MRKIDFKKILSAILVVVMLVTALPLTTIAAFAQDKATEISNSAANDKAAEEAALAALTPAQSIEKEMSERVAVTKTRTTAMKSSSEAGVYVDGTLVYEGKFKDTWRKALSYAPQVSSKDSKEKIDAMKEVEFVLNKDITFESTYGLSDNFENGAMYVAHQKVTIDLNGHILRRGESRTSPYADSVIWINDHSVVTIMDSNPTVEHKGKVKDHLWMPDSKGDVILKGGIICGGSARSRGGGIFINNSSTVYMTGGTVAGNDATAGSGIFLGERCFLDMSRGTSQVCYNSCYGSLQDGGAIYLSGTGPVLKGGYVHHNFSEDYGGGIMADDESFSIYDTIVYANKASEEGGGIYIGDERGSSSVISGARIVGNYSGERGGGVYIYSHTSEMLMNNCTVEYNYSKEHGGGICVSDYRGVDLTIAGKMIVRNNFKSSEKNKDKATDKSNLYLQGNEDLIVQTLLEGSEIWIRTGTSADKRSGVNNPITEGRTDMDPRYFYSDKGEYQVYYNTDPTSSNFHRYYLVKTKVRPTYSTVEVLDDTEVKKVDDYKVTINGKDEKFPLYRGIFEFNLMSTSEYSSASPFYYSDGYFMGDPKVYNEHLATMSINMAVAAFGRGTNFVPGNNYANHFANVKQLFADIGCEDKDFFANEDYQMQPHYYGDEDRLSTIGFAMSQKDIKFNGETYTLVPIAIRGGSYEVEWASNVTLGTEGEAEGFADAANQVTQHIKNYINDYGLTKQLEAGKVKFWVVGYSRAGATANLTSKRLVDAYGSLGNQVYGYTFEAPRGAHFEGVDLKTAVEQTAKDYPTIHNTINENDFVTLVAPMEMNFIRYGVDHLVGADHENKQGITSEQYLDRRALMIRQLHGINPNYNVNDRWEPGDINIIRGAIKMTDFVVAADKDDCDKECLDIYDFLRWFFYKVQGEGLDLPKKDGKYDMSLSREYYSEKMLLGGNDANKGLKYSDSKYNFGYSSMSVEEAVSGFMVLVNTASDETISDIISALSGAPGNIASDVALNIPNYIFTGITFAVSFALLSYFVFLPLAGIGLWWGLLGFGIAAVLSAVLAGLVFASKIIGMYNDYIDDWHSNSKSENRKNLNKLMHLIFDTEEGELSIWDVLGDEEAKLFAEGLPVLVNFLLNYLSDDNRGSGMNGIGSFVHNMDFIVSSHYQEVSVAWVRSCDSFYANETQAYRLAPSAAEAPRGGLSLATNTLNLSADEGSSIFYSIDDGATWTLYTKPVVFEEEPEDIKAFAISRGVKSIETPIDKNPYGASVFGNGNIWIVIVVSFAIIGASVAVIEGSRKKRRAGR